MSKELLVYVDLQGKPHFVGRLWLHERKGAETASFEYAREWRFSPLCFSLEPALMIGEGSFHTGRPLFGAIGDSAPDRWGRTLMERREAARFGANKQEIDFMSSAFEHDNLKQALNLKTR